jgi:hypothetical protein
VVVMVVGLPAAIWIFTSMWAILAALAAILAVC